ncbi:MAG: endonuclease/exonuclease/phosphatase family protein [Verrucomicrobiales bacterium]
MRRHLRSLISIGAPITIGAILVAVLLCYLNRWDSFVVITLIPIWAWAMAGMLSSIIFGAKFKSRVCIVLFFLWLLVGVLMSDETQSLGREFKVAVSGGKTVPKEGERVFRIITVNCSMGRIEAVNKVKDLKPDIVFLQEAPEKAKLDALIVELFEGQGSYVANAGNAIIARGRFENTEPVVKKKSTFRTRLQMPDGEVIDLANVHLQRSIPRFDLWKQAAWTEFLENRIDNRRTLRHLVRYRSESISSATEIPPLIVAGDFATPPGDDVFRMLKIAELEDASVSSGDGSGNTFPASFPLLRLDQIWHTDGIQAIKIESKRSSQIDHKIVICDFILSKESSGED